MKILVVEDNVVMIRILDHNLKKHGYETVLKNNGEEGLEYLLSHPDVALVITDISMPKMDGIEMLKRIKEESSIKHIPVIMCTASEDLETVKQTIALGASDYLLKPINAAQLLQKMHRLLDDGENGKEDTKVVENGEADKNGKVDENAENKEMDNTNEDTESTIDK